MFNFGDEEVEGVADGNKWDHAMTQSTRMVEK